MTKKKHFLFATEALQYSKCYILKEAEARK